MSWKCDFSRVHTADWPASDITVVMRATPSQEWNPPTREVAAYKLPLPRVWQQLSSRYTITLCYDDVTGLAVTTPPTVRWYFNQNGKGPKLDDKWGGANGKEARVLPHCVGIFVNSKNQKSFLSEKCKTRPCQRLIVSCLQVSRLFF